MSTQQKKAKRKKYPSDIRKNGWKKLKPYLPKSKSGDGKVGRTAAELREVINAIMYVVKTGCGWRVIPHDLPHWSTTYGYFYRWSKDGTWQQIHAFLVKRSENRWGAKADQRLVVWTLKAVKLPLVGASIAVLTPVS